MNDFLKYAMLRRLCGLPIKQRNLRIGVCWYLTDPTIVDRDNQQRDGHRVDYLLDDANWRRQLDPGLFDLLREMLIDDGRIDHARRSVAGIEAAGLLPTSTGFFNRQVPQDHMARAQWHQDCLAHLGDADVVFLDPDNSVSDLYIDPVRGGKWAAPHEAIDHRSRSQSVMWISHPRQQVRLAHHAGMMAAMHTIPGLFCSAYLGHCGFHFLICDNHAAIHRELRRLIRDGINRGLGTCRYFDSLGESINPGRDGAPPEEVPAVEANADPALERGVEPGIWEYREAAVVNDPGNLWLSRNPWLVPDRTCDVAFLLIDEQRIVTVRFLPFGNPEYRNGVRPLDEPGNRARWAEVSANASNDNLRVHGALVRQFPS